MAKTFDPAHIHPSFSNYAAGIEVAAGRRTIYVSGQVGVDKAGQVPQDPRAEITQAFKNVIAVVEEAGLGVEHLVALRVYLTRPGDTPFYREVRDQLLSGHRAASTLLVISALAHPDWHVEIEAVAAA